MPPEQAHHFTLALAGVAGRVAPARWVLQLAYYTRPKPVSVFGLDFKNAVGLAAGYDKDAVSIRGIAALGFGHIEVGTVTPLPQPGNPLPRMFRMVEDDAVINRMGFPSAGAAAVHERLNPSAAGGLFSRFLGFAPKDRKKVIASTLRKTAGCVLGVNIGKNKGTPNEKAVYDYLELLQVFAPLADYLTINVSSPNTAGLRDLQARRELESLLHNLHAQRLLEQKALERRLPLLVKLAPDLSTAQLHDALDAIVSTHMDGVMLTNTTLARNGLTSSYKEEAGGLSGKPLRAHSERMLAQAIKHLNSAIPVVSVGGVMSPEDARRRMDMGAALVQIYTGLIYEGPGLVKRIVRAL